MSISQASLSVFLAALCSSSFAAPNPVGTWTGHIKIALAPGTPADKAQKAQEQAKKFVISLVLKPDHTFTSSMGGPASKMPPQTGTWSTSGSSVNLTVPKAPKPQVFTLAPSGKSMSSHMAPKSGGSLDITFTR